MTSHRSRAAVAALALTLLLATPATAATALSAPDAAPATEAVSASHSLLELPRPTGPYATGRDTLHLTDTSRLDPWVPTAGARELMVSVTYPARPGTGGRPAPYMTTEEARLLLAGKGLEDAVPATTVATTRTYARTHAPAARGRFPLVVLSPGFSTPRTTLTGLAEELASRGYVVATVDHAYESTGTAFPGGRVLTCVACDRVRETGPEGMELVSEGRAADLSFVIDRLTGRHPAWHRAGVIDRQRIGVAGHSIGGSAAASTMATDPRVHAGINMDGTFADPVPATGLGDRPFLMLGSTADHSPGGDDSWDSGWPALDGWKRWLTVDGSGHFSFTDIPALAQQLGIEDPETPISGERSTVITREYVTAFFDQHLRGIHRPLLDGPTPGNPEVRFVSP
ncbi:alpha/beta hydrolase family protein [Streptomyces sp. NPDC057136]|uniref:alpha/beta hydrolase family protein n=1 Tax=Streptomyces sp. NPDC057136 TaxID=3346029 RepID=UPI00362A1FC9